ELPAEVLDLALKGELLVAALDGEVVVIEGFDLCLDLIYALRHERHLLHLRQTDQGVGRDKLSFEVRQRANAVVFLLAAIGALVADEGYKEAEFGDLDCDGLDIHAVETVLDEVELAAVVVFVVGEVA